MEQQTTEQDQNTQTHAQAKAFELRHLEQLDPRDMDEKTARRLIELCNLTHTGITAKEVLTMAAQGLLQLWVAKNGPDGLLITEVLRHNSGKELNVWGLIGDGLFRYFKGIRHDLVEIAKAADARWLVGYTNDPRLNRIYAKIAGEHARPFYRYLYLEDLEP